MRSIAFLFIFLSVLLPGCIMVPIPTKEDTVLSGKPVPEEQLAFLAEMRATREEVIGHLGNPDIIWEDTRVFIYKWDMRQGLLLWAVGAYYSGAVGVSDIPKHYLLLIQFDEQGRVQRFSREVRPATQMFHKFLLEWLEKAPGLPPVHQANPGERTR